MEDLVDVILVLGWMGCASWVQWKLDKANAKLAAQEFIITDYAKIIERVKRTRDRSRFVGAEVCSFNIDRAPEAEPVEGQPIYLIVATHRPCAFLPNPPCPPQAPQPAEPRP